MNELELIDESENERIYSYVTQSGTKYLVSIRDKQAKDGKFYYYVDYYEKQGWNTLVRRSKSSKIEYLEKLAKKMLEALPGRFDYVKA